jgi:hypothetical protein
MKNSSTSRLQLSVSPSGTQLALVFLIATILWSFMAMYLQTDLFGYREVLRIGTITPVSEHRISRVVLDGYAELQGNASAKCLFFALAAVSSFYPLLLRYLIVALLGDVSTVDYRALLAPIAYLSLSKALSIGGILILSHNLSFIACSCPWALTHCRSVVTCIFNIRSVNRLAIIGVIWSFDTRGRGWQRGILGASFLVMVYWVLDEVAARSLPIAWLSYSF